MDRKRLTKLLGLNLGIAAVNIITFSPGLFGLKLVGAGRLEMAFGSTIIHLSVTMLIYGNYKILTGEKKVIPIPTPEYYIEALNEHRGLKPFEKTVDLLIDQIVRLQKKNKTIRDILLQIFSDSEISYQKFDLAIAETEKIFFMNVHTTLNKLNAFNEEDYSFIRKKLEEGDFLEQFMEDKFKIYNEDITSVKAATEYNEQILLKLDKLLLLDISSLDMRYERGRLEQLTGIIQKLYC